MNGRFNSVVEEVELLIAERKYLTAAGPHFKILHRFRQSSHGCHPGEEVALVCLVHRSREFPLKLPLALRILFDYLARHHRLPQGAVQIEAGMRADAFCLRHGANAKSASKQTRKISRSAVKEYVKRTRYALGSAFVGAGINLSPLQVLVSEPTEGNEVTYRLKASTEWIHIDYSTK